MNRERLLHAIEVMRNVEAKQLPLDMGSWISHLDPGERAPFGDRDHTCGTAACFLGWCAFDPTFQAQGLEMEMAWRAPGGYEKSMPHRREIVKTINEHNRIIHSEHEFADGTVKYDDCTGTNAASAFFDISEAAADYLTLLCHYDDVRDTGESITPAMVIAHIENVLDGTFVPPDEDYWDANRDDYHDEEPFGEPPESEAAEDTAT